MNIIAIDIGNTNINIGLYTEGEERYIKTSPGENEAQLREILNSAWQEVLQVKDSEGKQIKGAIVVSSVKPDWTEEIRKLAEEISGQNILVIGKEIPLPIPVWVEDPAKVGTDRIVAAAAAYAVVEDTVIVTDVGTAITIDYVDDRGVFQGGVILPGFELSTLALKEHTAQLPKVTVTKPHEPYGKNTNDAISAGVYYAAVAAIQEIIRRYAEKIGRWPQTVLTGSAAKLIQSDCDFIDSYVPSLVVKGIVMAYQKYIEGKSETAEI